MRLAALSLLLPTLALAQGQVVATVETQGLVGGSTAGTGTAFYVWPDGGVRVLANNGSTASSESLLTYDLTGTFREAHVANGGAVAVDVRYGFAGRSDVVLQVDQLGTITLFGPSSSGLLTPLSSDNSSVRATNLNAASAALGWHDGTLFAFVGGQNGTLQQWSITPVGDGNGVDIEKVRSVTAGMSHSIVALAADELTDTLYLSIDSLGLATLPMTTDGGLEGLKLLDAGVGPLVAPRGLALYLQSDGGAVLLGSNNPDGLIEAFNRAGTYLGDFKIVADGGILGVSAPVGNAVLNMDAGQGSGFGHGVFAVVDQGDVAGPFVKLVPWESIAAQFTPPLPVDDAFDVRQLPHGVAPPPVMCDAGTSDGGDDGGSDAGNGGCGTGGGGGGSGTGGGSGGSGGSHIPPTEGMPVVDHHCGCDAGGGALLGALWLLGLALRRKA